MITVQIWSDYVCPFCYIGKRQLEQAIEQTGLSGNVNVQLRAFELDATTPKDANESTFATLSKKYGMSIEEAKNMTAGVAARAAEVGLTYDFESMRTQNTRDTHRVMKFAETKQLDGALGERLMKAYFVEGQLIGQRDVLATLAEEVGLVRSEVEAVIDDEAQFVEEVENDQLMAQQLQVRGVPFFVIDNKYGIAGAQPQQLFNDTLQKAAAEAGIRPTLQQVGDSGNVCGDDGCSI